MALVLAPVLPVSDWLDDLDALARRSPAFFVGSPRHPRRGRARARAGGPRRPGGRPRRPRRRRDGHRRGRPGPARGRSATAPGGRAPGRCGSDPGGLGGRRAGYARGAVGAGPVPLADPRCARPLRPDDPASGGRHHRDGLGGLRGRGDRGRLAPRLRRPARPGDRGSGRQPGGRASPAAGSSRNSSPSTGSTAPPTTSDRSSAVCRPRSGSRATPSRWRGWTRPYRPVQSGGRLARNASMPSRKSALV